jgi:hypothetical protein
MKTPTRQALDAARASAPTNWRQRARKAKVCRELEAKLRSRKKREAAHVPPF